MKRPQLRHPIRGVPFRGRRSRRHEPYRSSLIARLSISAAVAALFVLFIWHYQLTIKKRSSIRILRLKVLPIQCTLRQKPRKSWTTSIDHQCWEVGHTSAVRDSQLRKPICIRSRGRFHYEPSARPMPACTTPPIRTTMLSHSTAILPTILETTFSSGISTWPRTHLKLYRRSGMRARFRPRALLRSIDILQLPTTTVAMSKSLPLKVRKPATCH